MADIPIIVTRAEPGATETVERLKARGLTAILAPMLALVELPESQMPKPSDLSGLVFTSANGVRTYAARRSDRHLSAWCVGPATAQAARDEGFESVQESAGNAVDLANFIAERSPPSERPLLHVANAAATGVLRETLSANGHQTVFAPIYEMQPARSLPEPVAQLMDQNETSIVLVHSEKGASAFAAQAASRALSNCIGVAISERASQPLERLNLNAIYKAEAPKEDGLFAALEIALATLSA
ncbi:MAG: uroporphyrinogen-III synthase [Henriciella sp.]|nr:uroporphyrinogen-III synthase [Henriciella sp.]